MDARKVGLGLVLLVLGGGGAGCLHVQQKLSTLDADQRASDQRAAELQTQCEAVHQRRITIEEEYALGSAVSVNWVSQGGGLILPGSLDLNQQLNKIGKNLAAQSSRPNLGWTFGVLKSPGVNAVSGPGGYVFVSEGLLAQLDSEAELAGVLAHEISHITRKHALNEFHAYLDAQCQKTVRDEKGSVRGGILAAMGQDVQEGASRGLHEMSGRVGDLSDLLPGGGARALFTQLADQVHVLRLDQLSLSALQALTDNFVADLTDKGLPEQAEYDADLGALELMASAGYDPQAYIDFLGKLPERGLSTAHPPKKRRQQRLRDELQAWNRAASHTEDFVSPVDLSHLQRIPLRDALRQRGTQARASP